MSFLPAEPDFAIEHALMWSASTGQLELPVVVTETDQSTWLLVAAGPVRPLQRRQYVRVTMKMSVTFTMDPGEGEEPTPFVGTLLDLSEGGMRCYVSLDPRPAGSHLTVEFADLHVSGTIVRHVPTDDKESDKVALAIRFDDRKNTVT